MTRKKKATTRAAMAVGLALLLLQLVGCEPRQQLTTTSTWDETVDYTRSTPANCEHGALPYRDLWIQYRYPTQPGKYPLLVFAHGWNVDPDYYGAFLDDLAAGGYVVAAPVLPVAKYTPCRGTSYAPDITQQAFDISAVITHIVQTGSPITSRIEPVTATGVLGHSDGGMTVALMARGAGFHDWRVGAYAEIAGAIPAGTTTAPNQVPVLAVNGWSDAINNVSWADRFYNTSIPAKGEFVSAGDHTSLLNGNDANTFATRDAIVAFFDRWIRGDTDATIRFGVATSNAVSARTEGW
jgi:dienelactone hydrolase